MLDAGGDEAGDLLKAGCEDQASIMHVYQHTKGMMVGLLHP